MWKASAGAKINIKNQPAEDDDWETDPDFINDVTEEEQRWGSRTVEGSGRTGGAIDMEKLRKDTTEADNKIKKKQMTEGPNASFGYGGKFGVEKDRMDSSAMGHDYIAKVEKHVSQKDYSSGFGGKFGVQSDRQDQSAVGWDHVEKVHKHDSQKDYSVGFGGKFGVQSDRQDKCAVGWDHHEAPQKHESQIDHKIGFGGKFGVQTDRMDKSAASFNEQPEKIGTTYTKTKPEIGSAKPSDLRAKFEKMSGDEVKKQAIDKPVSKNFIQAKTAMFNAPKQEEQQTNHAQAPKQLDTSKTDLFNKPSQVATDSAAHVPKKLGQSKMAMFSEQKENDVSPQKVQAPKQLDVSKAAKFLQPQEPEVISKSDQIKQEIEELKKQKQKEEIETPEVEAVVPAEPKESPVAPVEVEETANDEQEEEVILEDTGLTAIALYDYQAMAEDEISFDPDDTISHIEMIDEGWWRGLCKNQYGLFPANYVQLQQ